jgi:hypothetical protein
MDSKHVEVHITCEGRLDVTDGIHPGGRVRTDHATRNVIEARVTAAFRSRSRGCLRSDAQSQVTMHYGKMLQ